MHVENQGRGHIFPHQPRQHDTGQKTFAPSGRPEDAAGAFDKAVQIQPDGIALLNGAAHREHSFALFTENIGHIAFIGRPDHCVVRRNRLNRFRPRIFQAALKLFLPIQHLAGIFRPPIHKQSRIHRQGCIERLSD